MEGSRSRDPTRSESLERELRPAGDLTEATMHRKPNRISTRRPKQRTIVGGEFTRDQRRIFEETLTKWTERLEPAREAAIEASRLTEADLSIRINTLD